MVAKITHGTSIYGAVSYNQKKIDSGQAKIICTNKIIVTRTGDESSLFDKTLMSFESYLSANKRTKKPVIHISLNPSPEDSVNESKLASIANDYMQQLGYGTQPYIVYKHTDIDRVHIHIVSVNIDSYGTKLDDSYQKLKSMEICRNLETKYGLKQVPDERKEDTRIFIKKVDYSGGDVKRQISNTVKSLIDSYKFQSLGEYSALLSLYNINVKHVRGEDEGNLFNGIVYSALSEDGQTIGNPIKSSRIGKTAGYNSLDWKMRKTAGQVKSGKVNLHLSKGVISEAMRNSGSKEQFCSQLKTKNIDVVFRENEEGRIYGVTFIDHNRKTVYNGSRIGKEFSANVFNRQFNENSSLPENRIPTQPDYHNKHEHSLAAVPISVDEIFGTFYLDNTSYDPEEEEFRRKLKRKVGKPKRRL